jgi:aminoglycoside phosphotransferase (APT) family kinase protein
MAGGNQPADDGHVSLAHGDFRMGNVIFAPDSPTVAAILDWELSTLGHPLADLGFCCMAWHTSPDEYGGRRTRASKASRLIPPAGRRF